MIEFETMARQAADYIKPLLSVEPAVGLVLGTGLGDIVGEIERAVALPYQDIPNHPVCTAPGHRGRLVCGKWAGKPVIAMDGRFHLYEGFTPRMISFPVRVLRLLGIQKLFISNAAGGLNPNFRAGDLMLVTDHINMTGQNPLVGPNIDRWGLRFPDMAEPYSRSLIELAEDTALKEGVPLRRGVYAGVLGPCLETAAETRFLRMSGADAVGMSTVMEVITAVHAGIEVLAISVITNVNLPDCYKPAAIEQIMETAAGSGKILGRLFEKIIERA